MSTFIAAGRPRALLELIYAIRDDRQLAEALQADEVLRRAELREA